MPTQIKNSSYWFFGIILCTIMNACTIRQENAPHEGAITVTGSAEEEVIPDEVYVTYTLKEYLDQTKKKIPLDKVKVDFLTACKKAGIPDTNISIANYAGSESFDYEYYRRRKRQPDFMATISYVVKFQKMEEIEKIPESLNEKSIQDYNISKTAYSKIEQLRKKVKTAALKASKEKATYLAQSIGEEIGAATYIQEAVNGYEEEKVMEFSNKSINYDSQPLARPAFEKIKIRYEMNVSFKLK